MVELTKELEMTRITVTQQDQLIAALRKNQTNAVGVVTIARLSSLSDKDDSNASRPPSPSSDSEYHTDDEKVPFLKS